MTDTTPEQNENLGKTHVDRGVRPPDAENSGATKKMDPLDSTGGKAKSSTTTNNSTTGSNQESSQNKKTTGTGGNPAKNNVDYTGATLSGRYEIVRLVGAGGMGSLYAGQHVDIKRKVAVKVLHRDFQCSEEVFLRFKQEATLAATLQHQNICSVYDFGRTDDGTPYLVMDLLEGKTLSAVLESERRLTPRRAVRIIAHICEALSHAHSKGVVHRDLKPSNIMIEGEDTKEASKLVDFGIAKSLAEDALRLTATQETIGSPYYMSPEQCQALPIDHRTDIYSLGCVLYECLAGKTPFKASTALQTMYSHVHTEPESFKLVVSDEEIPEALEEVVFKAMAKNPNDRFQSAEDFKQAAFAAVGAMSHDCLRDEYTNAASPNKSKRAIANPKRNIGPTLDKSKTKPKLIALVLGAVTLLGLAGFGLTHQEDISLLLDGRTPGEIYNGDDLQPQFWDFPTITNPAVYGVYLGQGHDTPRSKDNDLSIMGHAKVRVTAGKPPNINLVLLSHSQIEWKVDTAPGTKVENYIVWSTYGTSKVKGVPEDKIIRIDLSESGFDPTTYTSLDDYSSFQVLNKKVAEALGKTLGGNGIIFRSMQGAQQLKEFQVSDRPMNFGK